MSSGIDSLDWDTGQPLECECIDAKIGTISTAGGQKHVIILTLLDHAHGREMVRFFNTRQIKGSNYSVPRNGSFAKLYRITIGENPVRKFSKSQQLMKHLIGEYFVCVFQNAEARGVTYRKVTQIQAMHPKKDERWLEDGRLLKRRKSTRRDERYFVEKKSINEKPFGNRLETDWQLSGNQLETQYYQTPQQYCDESENQSHKNIQRPRVVAYQHASEVHTYMAVKVRNSSDSRERNIYYTRMPSESNEEYLDRVIDTSLNEDYLEYQERLLAKGALSND